LDHLLSVVCIWGDGRTSGSAVKTHNALSISKKSATVDGLSLWEQSSDITCSHRHNHKQGRRFVTAAFDLINKWLKYRPARSWKCAKLSDMHNRNLNDQYWILSALLKNFKGKFWEHVKLFCNAVNNISKNRETEPVR
jgi:hypothetical protein